MHRGPEPEDVPTVTVDIAAGDSWDSAPIRSYLTTFTPDILAGTYIGTYTTLDAQSKNLRAFGLEVRFAATVDTGAGFVAFQQLFKGEIIARLSLLPNH